MKPFGFVDGQPIYTVCERLFLWPDGSLRPEVPPERDESEKKGIYEVKSGKWEKSE